jgi:crotonobetainyl-CoA:carnitine CoA-transferase CaiB-like acyl-CoA transferase
VCCKPPENISSFIELAILVGASADGTAGGTVPNIALAYRLSGTPLADPVAAPILGQHSEEVLRDLLGYGPAEIGALAQRGVIGRLSYG